MEDDLHGWMMGCNNELGSREVETLDLGIADEMGRMKRMKHDHHQNNTCSVKVTVQLPYFLVTDIKLVTSFF